MIKTGVIGYPISHSLSPKLHGYLLQKYKIDGEYKAIEVKPENLEQEIDRLINEKYAGFNVTVPHKEKVFELAQKNGYKISSLAQAVKAVNTIYVDENNVINATNSDAFGFYENLRIKSNNFQLLNSSPSNSAIVLGGGGAANAIVYNLIANCKFEKIYILNRTNEKALKLANYYENYFITNKLSGDKLIPFNHIEAIEEITPEVGALASLLVNTTSLGMQNQPELNINLTHLNKSAIVYDIVYNPLFTNLLKTAQERGNPIITGIGMLIYQAFEGFEKWFGVKPELTDEEFEELTKILLSK
jgi:shikimate dehydrogenase